MLKCLFWRELHRAEMAPWGWGQAWPCWHKDVVYIMPVPLNIAAGLLRWLYICFVRGVPPHVNDRRR